MVTEVINAVFSGLVLALGAYAAAANVRARRIAVDRRAYRQLQRRYVIALQHLYDVEQYCALRGVVLPPRPAELEESDDDADTAAPPTPPPPSLPAP